MKTSALTRTSGKRTKTTDRERISGKCNRNNWRLFCELRSNSSKKEKSIKILPYSRKLNEVTNKRKAQLPIMQNIISRISRKISEGEDSKILATTLDFDYAYGQINLDEKTRNFCIFTVTGGEFTGYYRFLKDSMEWQISQQFAKNGSINHWNTNIRHGLTI